MIVKLYLHLCSKLRSWKIKTFFLDYDCLSLCSCAPRSPCCYSWVVMKHLRWPVVTWLRIICPKFWKVKISKKVVESWWTEPRWRTRPNRCRIMDWFGNFISRFKNKAQKPTEKNWKWGWKNKHFKLAFLLVVVFTFKRLTAQYQL